MCLWIVWPDNLDASKSEVSTRPRHPTTVPLVPRLETFDCTDALYFMAGLIAVVCQTQL